MGYGGMTVAPDPEEINFLTREDLRPATRTTLTITVWFPTIREMQTFATGDRFPEADSANNPAHERIMENSPVQSGDLFKPELVEEYIEGREFYLGLVGNKRVDAFPLWELNIPNLPEGAPRIATRKLKWDIGYQKTLKVKNHAAKGLSSRKQAEIERAGKAVYRALGLSGFARLDIRMRPDGRFYFLEANPNPDLTYGEDFAESAEAAGISYESLIERICDLGIRYPVEWKRES